MLYRCGVRLGTLASQAMQSLYHITGQRLTKKEQWLRWYATDYPRWKARPRAPQ